MSDLLPIVEQLADADTHAERSDWLFRCPISVLHRESMAIRRILHQAGLIAGVAYLEAVLSMSNARRLPDGQFPQTVVLPVHISAQDLGAAVRAVEGVE